MGMSQPRVVAIERSPNVTLDVIAKYAEALGGHIEVNTVRGGRRCVRLGRHVVERNLSTTGGRKAG